MKQLKTTILLAIMFLANFSYASELNKAPLSTNIQIVNKSTGMFLFTTGTMLSYFNAVGIDNKVVYTSISFEIITDGIPKLLATGHYIDTPTINIVSAIQLVDGGNTWDFPEPIDVQPSWSCVSQRCCDLCNYNFGTQLCGCAKQKTSEDCGWGGLTLPFDLYSCMKHTNSEGWLRKLFDKFNAGIGH